MAVIVPAITAEKADQYKKLMEQVQSFAERLHVDISDGEFAAPLIGEKDAWWPANVRADVHAMVAKPSEHLDALLKLKPSLIIFHAEVQEDLLPILQQIKSAGVKAGVALQRSTVPSDVSGLIEAADHALIFSGDLGHYGGVASLMQLEKIRLIHEIRPNIEIGWDGGVTIENAFSIAQGGVEVMNVGGEIAKSKDPAATYKKLLGELDKHGVI